MNTKTYKNIPHLILASKSPRRKELLSGVGVNFSVETAEIGDENRFFENNDNIEEAIMMLARAKNAPVSRIHPDLPVISADTIIVLDNKVIGKPRDRADAHRILTALSGREHTVLTAVNLTHKRAGFDETILEKTTVRFRELSAHELENYLDGATYLDKAGAYGIQDKGLFFVERINGCYSNIVGLPISSLLNLLNRYINF